MNWKAGISKVFATEKEAMDYCKAMNSRGIVCGWSKTDNPVTHIHIKDGYTKEVQDA